MAGNIFKGGWHPSGDKEIHRKTWKSDLKGIAGRKKYDSVDKANSHASAPLSSLKDPDSFGPPPKHSAYYGDVRSSEPAPVWTATSPVSSPGPATPARVNTASTVSTARTTGRKETDEPKAPPGPYSMNTTGLRTDHLPPPPGRRDGTGTPVIAASRPVPSVPPRQATGPPPVLPPRQTEHPHEHTPEAPPSYGEALHATDGAAGRLSRAGVNVPDLGIGSTHRAAPQPSSQMGHGGQLSELQQRFARMNAGASSSEHQDDGGPSAAVIAQARKKPPPPRPAKRNELLTHNDGPAPPPIPMSSKPRPG